MQAEVMYYFSAYDYILNILCICAWNFFQSKYLRHTHGEFQLSLHTFSKLHSAHDCYLSAFEKYFKHLLLELQNVYCIT